MTQKPTNSLFAFQHNHIGIANTSNIDEVLKYPDIDVVHVCTPNNLHYPIAKKALEAELTPREN